MNRLLIIDDNPDDRFLVIRYLRREFGEHLEADEVNNMAQFEAALDNFNYDLVITDYHLRWTDGLQVLHHIKERYSDCPVIMFTGTGNEEIVVQALKAGLDDYLLKSPKNYAQLPVAARIALHSAAQQRSLRELEQRCAHLVAEVPIGLLRMKEDGTFLNVNPALVEMLHYPDAETLKQTPVHTLYVDVTDSNAPWMHMAEGDVLTFTARMRCYDKRFIWAETSLRCVLDADDERVFDGSVRDITAQQERAHYLSSLAQITRLALQESDRHKVLTVVAENLQALFAADSCYITEWDEDTQRVLPATASGLEDIHAYLILEGMPAEGTLTASVRREKRVLSVPDPFNSPYILPEIAQKFPMVRSVLALPLSAHGKFYGMIGIGFHTPHSFSEKEISLASDLSAYISLVFVTSVLLQETRQHLSELDAVHKASLQLTDSLDHHAVLETILLQIYNLLNIDNGHIFLFDGKQLTFGIAMMNGNISTRPIAQPRENGATMQTALSGKPLIIDSTREHELYANYMPDFDGALACFPLRAGGQVRGVLNVAYEQPHHFLAHEIRMLELLADQAAIAIQNARLYDDVQRSLQRLQSLRTIDNTITVSMDISITLGVVLEQILRQLGVDAAALALFQPATTSLQYMMVRGRLSESVFPKHTIRLGNNLCGQVALRRKPLIVEDFNPESNELTLSEIDTPPKIYVGLPLVAKGNLQGVLETYFFDAFHPNDDWLSFANTLTTQTAIAIENAQLFESLQHSNFELELAYDQTLEGWARTMEWRGTEPPGHISRIVELCLTFARRVIQDEKHLVDIRRGTLLHDVGKLAIPDEILLKPGPLTDAEWEIMRQHPVYARELLYPIHFLRRALVIPYAHHEHWDGSGYPRGLSGERIPLEARIFALVDVWDALTSERPYRPAWPPEKVIEYIQEQAGKLFDPNLTPIFLDVLRTRPVHF